MTTTAAGQAAEGPAGPQSFAEAQDALAAALPGYTRREPQEKLAAAIEDAIAGRSHLLAQAGTGTGKSMGALIPAILHAVRNESRVVVATATIALQAQYTGSDLPFLQEHLGVPFRWALIKGRSNYLCLDAASRLQRPTAAQQQVLDAARQDPDADGDKDKLPQVSGLEWSQLSVSAAECPGKKSCPFGDLCYAEKARQKAAEADVVITNTAYLAQDLRLRGATAGQVALLGEYETLIADEAHTLPDAITSALEDSVGQAAMDRLASDAGTFLDDFGRSAEPASDVTSSAAVLWRGLELAHQGYVTARKEKPDTAVPLRQGAVPARLMEAIDASMAGLADKLGALRSALSAVARDIPREDKKSWSRASRLVRRAGDWEQRVGDLRQSPEAETVKWLEKQEITVRGRKERRLYLRSAPVSVAPFMREHIWEPMTAILMSATLTSGRGDFGYLEETTGLKPGEADHFDAGSPFDYASQARVFVPARDVPAPAGKDYAAWRVYARDVTRYLVEAAGGGALLLFTSKSALEESYQALAPAFRAAGLTVLKQGEAPSGRLKDEFKADRDSVLFGLKTFMEGIDVQGDALRLTVIDKLPFPVPSDLLFQARCEAADRRWGARASFGRLSVPMMSLTLIQAFGRLIRHRDDRGVVAILDSRLQSKGYGHQILRSLPPAPVTTSPQAAAEFLRNGRG